MLVPVEKIAWVEAEGELLHLMTDQGERHTITRPLKGLESRLAPTVSSASRGARLLAWIASRA